MAGHGPHQTLLTLAGQLLLNPLAFYLVVYFLLLQKKILITCLIKYVDELKIEDFYRLWLTAFEENWININFSKYLIVEMDAGMPDKNIIKI